jgi:chorismate mutase/prephenate dehydratase
MGGQGGMMKKRTRAQSLQALKERRKQIDAIDQKLLSLLNQRLSIALKIGKIKKERGEKIYNPKREDEILKRLDLKNRGPLKEEDLKKIFKKIMIVCRKSQIT